MSFSDILGGIVEEIEGASGIALVGMDGIVVEEQKKDPLLDLQSLGAEWCAIIRQMDKPMSSLGLGNSEEISVATEKSVIVTRRIHDGYFLILAIQKDGNFGKARYLLRKEGINLKSEL